jgi:hypothetical protein
MCSLFSSIRGFALLIFLVLSLTAFGCGSKTGTISGKVTYQGKAVTGGSVNFLSEGSESIMKTGGIQKDGSYSVSGVPVGPAKITVQGVKARRLLIPTQLQKEQGKAEVTTDQPEIYVPPKYGSADTSDLKYEVKPGKQHYDIELK